MPIKRHYIVLSKIIELYVSALLFTIAIMIPTYVVYINNVSVEILFNIYYFISLIFIPCIPVVIATLIGYLISFISTFFKRKDLVQLITGIGVFFLAFYFGKHSARFNMEDFGNFGKMVLDFFNNYYPVTRLYKSIVIDYNILSLIYFIIINIILLTILTFVITKTYTFINSKLHQARTSKNKKIKELKKSSLCTSLLKKDFKKLFSSSNYLLNTCIGFLILFLCAFGLITSTNTGIITVSEIGNGFGKIIFAYSMTMFLGYIYPTSVSLSLEGKNFYILRILPIKFKDIIKEKMLFHLIISMPITIITILAIIFKLEMKIKYAIPMLVLYIVITLFYSLFHILLDMLFLKLSWENEIKVIKRSIQSIISLVVAIFIGVLPLIGVFKTTLHMYIYISAVVLLTIACYIILITYGSKKFNSSLN
jgi:ABC-2 type transport system permease protein